MADTYDLVVIGGGPGGYVAAIRAAQLGMKTALVDKRESLGGTCLNVGCIPSKALLQSSHLYEVACHDFETHGIKATGVEVDLAAMMKRKETVVRDLTQGIAFLMRKNKIDHLTGTATIAAVGDVAVRPAKRGGKGHALPTERILIATGSEAATLAGVEIDEKRIVSSTGALSLAKVPKTLTVIGAGYIGLEMASVWRRLGSEVTVVEFLDRVLPGMDAEVSKHMQRILKKQGLDFRLSSKVTGARSGKDGVRLSVEPRDGGKADTIKAGVVLVAVGA